MAEPGGPTAQSGIIYQNSISALYMGRLCDSTPRPAAQVVVGVRVEAPTDVDDTVVTYGDGHRTFIQAKENVRDNGTAWAKLWKDLESQFWDTGFQRDADRLLFHVGEIHEEHRDLRELGARAATSTNYTEWVSRLSHSQVKLLRKIRPLFTPQHSGDEDFLILFKHLEVEIRPLEDIERDLVPYWVPSSNKSQQELFRLLRDRVGGAGRRRASFTADSLRASLAAEGDVAFITQPALDELRERVKECGAGLKQHKHNFGSTGAHLKRTVVETITAWALQPSAKDGQNNVAILLDSAGMGKTVVARDVLYALENAGVAVLAIKADQLSGVSTAEELQSSLRLPDTTERVLRRLAADTQALLLIDQIDALSLSLARDQRALNVVLDLVARARLIPGVRILMSCRTFDLNNDPRLRSIESGNKFHLTGLTDDEINEVIRGLDLPHIEFEKLSRTTRELLRIPLHLDLFARSLSEQAVSGAPAAPPTDVKSLQDLYTLLWQNVVRKTDRQAPPVHDREQAILLLTDAMNRRQRTAIPQSILSAPDTAHLETAAQWLSSEGILIPTGAQTDTVQASSEWTFIHQTFFDYCYAKSFVENRRPLFETVRDGDQGLFARPQVIHVLVYLRGTDQDAYLRELSNFLNAHPDELRYHLRDHVIRWFGSLPDPSDQEWLIARRVLTKPNRRAWLLGSAQGNPGWFARLKASLASGLEVNDDETLDRETLPFLLSMLESAQVEVVSMLRPYLGKSELWDSRIRNLIRSVRTWKTAEAVALYEDVFRGVPASELKHFYELDDLAKVHPEAGCRLIRAAFDRILEEHVSDQGDEGRVSLRPFSFSRALEVLNGSTIVEALNAVVNAAPRYFLEAMMPWLERVISHESPADDDQFYFRGDALSGSWYSPPFVVHHRLNEAFIGALTELARRAPAEFREVAKRLESLPYSTPQRYMAHAYRNVADAYAEEAVNFLTSDQRRLDLGDREQYDTRKLIEALTPQLTDAQLARLEATILSYDPVRKYRGLGALRWRGLERLYLLQSLPADRLTSAGSEALRELGRKFPDQRASEKPSGFGGGFVGPPIPDDVAKRMNDSAWLGAMDKYQGRVEHKDFLKGGAQQQAGVLLRRVQEEPERFHNLAIRVPIGTDQAYLRAFINGLAESSAPAGWTYDAIRRFAPVASRETKRAICWALQKRVEEGIPDDLIELLEGYVRGEAGEDERWWIREEEMNREHGREISLSSGGPYSSYLNSVRGSAFATLMRTYEKLGGAGARPRKWALIEQTCADDSTALRAGAVEEILYLLDDERERALTIFERLMEGHPALLRSHYVDDFLYHGFYKNYFRMKPYILAMMNEQHEELRQRGAELACIAAISPRAMESDEAREDSLTLAESAITGEIAWRRGAARVYAGNVDNDRTGNCAAVLVRLLNDDDEQVRGFVSSPFRALREEHVFSLRQFIELFAASRALFGGLHDFAEYMWEHGPIDPLWALTVIESILDNRQGENSEVRFAGGEELIRLVLRVYTDPTIDDATRYRAMNLFDRLLEKFPWRALTILQEWDRR